MIRLLCAVLALLSLASTLSAEPFPFKAVVAEAQFLFPKVSPDGNRIAALFQQGDKQILMQLELPDFKQQPLAYMPEAKLLNFWWKGNDCMLVIVGNTDGSSDFRSYDLRTKKTNKLRHLAGRSGRLVHPLPDDPDNVLIAVEKGNGADLFRMNIHTGGVTVVEKNPGHATAWLVNHTGEPVVAVCRYDKLDFLLWRPSRTAEWQRQELGPENHPELNLVSIHADQRRIIAWDYTREGPARVVALDPATMAKEELFSSPVVEADRVVSWSDDPTSPRAIHYETDMPSRVFLDDKSRQIQSTIDASLPATENEITSTSADEQVMTVLARSDRERGTYYLLDRRQPRLTLLGKFIEDLAPASLRPNRPFKFKTTDGLSLDGRLTLPAAGPQKPPLIVITGDEFAGPRALSGFDAFTQMFATRGYAVAYINYRGTSGYSRAFSKAGDNQIAQRMPKDIEEGVQWLINEKLVDPQRIGLFGRNWGGVVAMHALARSSLFAAWINWNTPTNIEIFDFSQLTMLSHDHREAIADLGGPSAASKYRESIDPKRLVAEIHVPSFHFYNRYFDGTLINGGSTMEDLLRDHSAAFTFVRQKQHRVHEKVLEEYADVFRQLIDFLDKNVMARIAPETGK